MIFGLLKELVGWIKRRKAARRQADAGQSGLEGERHVAEVAGQPTAPGASERQSELAEGADASTAADPSRALRAREKRREGTAS
jgi:hypothetical protein